jgi:hypothetical protein
VGQESGVGERRQRNPSFMRLSQFQMS